MPITPLTVVCGTCSHRDPVWTRQEAVANALRHRAQHPGQAVAVRTSTGLTLAERFLE